MNLLTNLKIFKIFKFFLLFIKIFDVFYPPHDIKYQREVFMFKCVSKILASFVIGLNSLMGISPLTTQSYYSSTSSNYIQSSFTVAYDHYEVTEFFIPELLPFYNTYNLENSCAPTAGTTIIGYYDHYYNDLIDNYDSAFYDENGNFVSFRGVTDTIYAIEEDLYDLMGTNVEYAGTTQTQFKSGLTNYVNARGFYITYPSCGSPLNISTLQSQINFLRPVVVFMSGFEYYPCGGFQIQEDRFCLISRTYTMGHVAVAFGYQKYKLYDSNNNNFRTDEYLLVASGESSYGFVKLNSSATTIDACWAVNLFSV